MRRARFRFGLLSLMGLVAAVALTIGAVQLRGRGLHFRSRAAAFAAKEGFHASGRQPASEIMVDGRVWTKAERVAYYRALRLKYERAARAPWRSVEPDPPEPRVMAGFDVGAMQAPPRAVGAGPDRPSSGPHRLRLPVRQ